MVVWEVSLSKNHDPHDEASKNGLIESRDKSNYLPLYRLIQVHHLGSSQIIMKATPVL